MHVTRYFVLIPLLSIGLLSQNVWARHSHQRSAAAEEHAPPAETVSLAGGDATVAFSPNGDATRVIVAAINGAKKQVLVQAYGFTSPPIIKALGDARARGVDVQAILDKTNESKRYSGATYLGNHGIPVWIDNSVAIAHNKIMIIDGDSVISGSFNFTKAAQEKNAENVLYLNHVPDLAKLFTRNWQWRKSLSQAYREPSVIQ